MIQSMTGYGMGSATTGDLTVTVEIKSLNSKNLDLHFRLPGHYFQQEILLKNALGPRLVRGKVMLNMYVEKRNSDNFKGAVNIDFNLIQSYYFELEKMRKMLGIDEQVPLASLLALPNVVTESASTVEEEEWKLVLEASNIAVDKLIHSRQNEGKHLKKDLMDRYETMLRLINLTDHYNENRIENIKNKLTNALQSIAQDVNLNKERFDQELIYYLEKYDINEERVRIHAHLFAFFQALEQPDNHGRKLTFIVQELFREVNTLGVKAYNVEIQTIVVQMKEELEKAKEQLMNIL